MRRATWFFAVVLALVVLASCAGPAVQDALLEDSLELSAVKTSLDRIEAEGYAWHDDACDYRWLWFTAVEEKHDSGSGGATTQRFLVVDYYRYDSCEGIYGYWYGTIQLDAEALKMRGNLGSADLRVEAELSDAYGGAGTVHLVLDLTLTGFGDRYTTKTKEQSDTGDGKVKTQTTSEYRYADVSGSILADGVRMGVDDPSTGMLRSWSTKTTYPGTKPTKADRNVSIDWFNGWPYFVVEGEPGYLEWWVSGRDPITLTIEPDVGDVSGQTSATVWPTETTTYTLTARNRWSEASAEVTLYVRPRLDPDELEPNDTREFATSVALDYASPVLTLVPGDVDWFTFSLDVPAVVVADVDSRDDGSGYYWLDSMLAIFDDAGAFVTGNDDDGYSFDPRIEITLPAGTFYLAVTGFADFDVGGWHAQQGYYDLRIEAVPAVTSIRVVPDGTYLAMADPWLGDPDVSTGTRVIGLGVGWDASWRGSDRPSWVGADDNWDAAWVFAKFREPGGVWRHATLADAGAPAGAVVDVASDGLGALVQRDAQGHGYFGPNDVELQWAYEADGVAADAVLEVRVFGIEMVYVPEGAFYAGSGGTGRGEFRAGGTTGDPFLIDAQGSIDLGSGTGELDWTAEYDSGTAEGSTDSGFPTGFGAFYLMKHELTQGQYAAFLNTLTQEQANARRINEWGARFALEGYAVGEYWSWLPHVPLNFATWADGTAFADWAGLRPMTELEFEKAARGTMSPVADEYAWGSTVLRPAYGLLDEGTDVEAADPADANANVEVTGYPIRVGAFAAPGKSREDAGAGYYGALDLTGNLWENVVTIGLPEGRAFTGMHGDGALDEWGDANVDGWPGPSALGAGFRGGNYRDDEVRARTSDRIDVAQEKAWHDDHHGWRGVRTAP